MTIADQIASGALAITIAALVWQMHQSYKQARLQSFTAYTQRYQEILINLPINIESDEFDLNLLDEKEKNTFLKWMRAYFDLCSEEFYLYKKRMLDKAVWTLWESGIQDSINKPAFQQAWGYIQKHKYYDKEFSKYIKDLKQKK